MRLTCWKMIALLLAMTTMQAPPIYAAQPHSPPGPYLIDARTHAHIVVLYKQLIDAENRHDLASVRPLVWTSPTMLFVAKTKTAAEGNWAGFWGTDVTIQHLRDFYKQTFHISPDYAKERVVALAPDVMETYAPVMIAVAYAGQSGLPKPFIMILDWVKTPTGWKMATDIALPVPSAPHAKS